MTHSNSVQIRPAKPADDKAIRELIAGILEKEFAAAEKDYFGSDVQNVSKTYAGDGDCFFVASSNGEIVGTAGIKREDDRNALLRRIFVRDDFRGRKIGSQLILNAVQFCRKEGYGEIIFKSTSRMKDAIRLCEANGFIRRATIRLGSLDLFKFTLHLEEDASDHVLVSEKEKRRKS